MFPVIAVRTAGGEQLSGEFRHRVNWRPGAHSRVRKTTPDESDASWNVFDSRTSIRRSTSRKSEIAFDHDKVSSIGLDMQRSAQTFRQVSAEIL